jgi:hypothetical protein
MLFLDALQENKGFNCRFKCFHVNFGQCDFELKKMHKNYLCLGSFLEILQQNQKEPIFSEVHPFFYPKKYNFSFGAFFHLWPYLTFFWVKGAE